MIMVYVREIEEISKRLDARNKAAAIVGMSNIIPKLRTKHNEELKDTYTELRELEAKIQQAGNKFSQPVEIRSLQRREAASIGLDKLYTYFNKIIQVMYEGGYLSNEGYKFTLKDDGKKFG